MRTILLLLLVGLVVGAGCARDDGDWQPVEIAGVRPAADAGAIEVIPAAYSSPSCTDVRARLDRDGDVLRVTYETRRTAADCTLELGSPTQRAVVIDGAIRLDRDTAVRFTPGEPPIVARRDTPELRRDVDRIRVLRTKGGITTTAAQVEALLTNDEFLANWDGAGVPFLDEELDNPNAFALGPTGGVAVALAAEAGFGPNIVDQQLRFDPGRVVVRVTGPDPIGVAAQIRSLWDVPTLCVGRIAGSCVEEISTEVLVERVVVEPVEPGRLTPGNRCSVFAGTSAVPPDPELFWPDTLALLAELIPRAAAQLVGGDITDPTEVELVRAAAREVLAAESPAVWIAPPPWATETILGAWSVLRELASACGRELPALR